MRSSEGLIALLLEEARRQGRGLGDLAAVSETMVRSKTSRGRFSIEARETGVFGIRVEGLGLELVAGSTKDLTVLVAALLAWQDGTPLGEITNVWPDFPMVFPLPDLHEAVPGQVVETSWRLTLEQHRGIRLGDREVAKAAYAEPRLRALFPHPSHGAFGFMRNTQWPFVPIKPNIVLAEDGYLVSGAYFSDVLGRGLSAREAAALVVAHLPAECGAAIEGKWPEHH
jgi:hypothetical protein